MRLNPPWCRIDWYESETLEAIKQRQTLEPSAIAETRPRSRNLTFSGRSHGISHLPPRVWNFPCYFAFLCNFPCYFVFCATTLPQNVKITWKIPSLVDPTLIAIIYYLPTLCQQPSPAVEFNPLRNRKYGLTFTMLAYLWKKMEFGIKPVEKNRNKKNEKKRKWPF